MKRRNFIQISSFSGLGLFCPSTSNAKTTNANHFQNVYSTDSNKASIFTSAQVKPTRIFHITDTHLSMKDDREIPFQEYSNRMAGAYKINKHFKRGEELSTKESFEQTLQLAKEQKADFIALTGDIFSFPSEAAVEWAAQKLKDTSIPYAYVAGNHDWHYEGMPGSSQQLRSTWTEKRLRPMYQGNNPLFAAYDVNGVRFICIDNSIYEILPEQLEFFKSQVKSPIPLVLLMHIPLYIPGRSLGYGCAHPDWGASTDRGFELERREKWREGGHTKTTLQFHTEVFNAPNLMGILAGHTHKQALDIKNGIPQFVSGHNATGFYTDLNISSQ